MGSSFQTGQNPVTVGTAQDGRKDDKVDSKGGKSISARDLVVGGRYLHVNGHFIREIDAIEGDTVLWRDQWSTGQCSKRAFLMRCSLFAPQKSLPGTPPHTGGSTRLSDKEFTIRDEANALTAFAFRNGFIEELHAGRASPLLQEPGYSRITDDEMRRLMIEASEKLARKLQIKRSNPKEYGSWIRSYNAMYCRKWKRD